MPALLTLALLCAACAPPAEPPRDKPPEPQATQLRDAIQAPIDKAKAVEDTVQDAADAQRAAIEAAGG
ncbi:hypothetical protein FQY83_06630 [Luteimonas marina]|uniref:Uncharacterized protein n=2 Tax=Luteimonas marina TaxID=488485 RepID=A0A5C5U8P1_9GAMM|nr:hypothetical protein FQY83_06630 [Luteimonas marina]